ALAWQMDVRVGYASDPRDLCGPGRLCERGCSPSRNALCDVDAARDLCSERARDYSLFRDPRSVDDPLPLLLGANQARLRVLPQLRDRYGARLPRLPETSGRPLGALRRVWRKDRLAKIG